MVSISPRTSTTNLWFSSNGASKLAPKTKRLLLSSTKIAVVCIAVSIGLTWFIYRFEQDRKERSLNSKSRAPSPAKYQAPLNNFFAQNDEMSQSDFFKGIDFLTLPELETQILEKSKTLEITSGFLPDIQETKTFFRKVVPAQEKPYGTVLLLHGQSFTSENWESIKTLKLIAAVGWIAIAVDLPVMYILYNESGYGQTQGSAFHGDPVDYFRDIKEALDTPEPYVVISPSMSGHYALPLLNHYPPLLAGYVPVAPIETSSIRKDEYSKIQVPTLIVYGDRDTSLGLQSLNNLKNLPVSATVKIPDAGHAAYLNQPDIFHKALLKFLNLLNSSV